MHTTIRGNTVFTHNGDYSGIVEIKNCDGDSSVSVKVEDLRKFVGEIVSDEISQKMEEMDLDIHGLMIIQLFLQILAGKKEGAK